MTAVSDNIWTRPNIKQQVTDLLRQGASYGHIANVLSKQYQRKVTRNAVCGWLNRNVELLSCRPARIVLRGNKSKQDFPPKFTPVIDAYIRRIAEAGFVNRPAYVAERVRLQFGVKFAAVTVAARMRALGLNTPENCARLPDESRQSHVILRKYNKPAAAHLLKAPTNLSIDDSARAGLPLLQAGVFQCRWPVSGEREHLMVCGEHTAPGQSYCLHHMLRSHRKEAY